MWAFAFGRGPCLPRSPRLLASFCFLIRAHQVQIRGKALDFPDGAHAGGDPYPLPSPGIPDWRGFQGVSSQGIPDWRGFQKNLVAPPPSAVGFPPLTRFAYTLPPPPPIRILKHLCDFVPGCPGLARVCQPLWPFASCTCFRVVKDPSNTPLFALERIPDFTICSLYCQEKNTRHWPLRVSIHATPIRLRGLHFFADRLKRFHRTGHIIVMPKAGAFP
jgi:hypothetical protein